MSHVLHSLYFHAHLGFAQSEIWLSTGAWEGVWRLRGARFFASARSLRKFRSASRVFGSCRVRAGVLTGRSASAPPNAPSSRRRTSCWRGLLQPEHHMSRVFCRPAHAATNPHWSSRPGFRRDSRASRWFGSSASGRAAEAGFGGGRTLAGTVSSRRRTASRRRVSTRCR